MMTIGGTILTIISCLSAYICLYPFVDRICKCVERCADNTTKAAGNEEDDSEE